MKPRVSLDGKLFYHYNLHHSAVALWGRVLRLLVLPYLLLHTTGSHHDKRRYT